MREVILVVTHNCPYCPSVDKLWHELKKKYEFNYRVVDAVTDEGMQFVEKYGILSVPVTIIDDKLAFIGVPQRQKAEEAIRQV